MDTYIYVCIQLDMYTYIFVHTCMYVHTSILLFLHTISAIAGEHCHIVMII